MIEPTAETAETTVPAEVVDYTEYIETVISNQTAIIENQQTIIYYGEQQSQIMGSIFFAVVLFFVWSVMERFINHFFGT